MSGLSSMCVEFRFQCSLITLILGSGTSPLNIATILFLGKDSLIDLIHVPCYHTISKLFERLKHINSYSCHHFLANGCCNDSYICENSFAQKWGS